MRHRVPAVSGRRMSDAGEGRGSEDMGGGGGGERDVLYKGGISVAPGRRCSRSMLK